MVRKQKNRGWSAGRSSTIHLLRTCDNIKERHWKLNKRLITKSWKEVNEIYALPICLKCKVNNESIPVCYSKIAST